MILDPFERYLGVPRGADPLTLLGLTPEAAAPTEVETAMRKRIATIYAHPDGRSAEAEVVRRALRAAADALRDPVRRRRWIPAEHATAATGRRTARQRSVQLTEFDRNAMAVLVSCGGWNAVSRARLVALAAANGVTVQGLQRVITGLSEYAKSHGPRIGVREITAGARLREPVADASRAEPTYVDRVLDEVGSELRGENPHATMRVAMVFGGLTFVAAVIAIVMIFFVGDGGSTEPVVNDAPPAPAIVGAGTKAPPDAPPPGPRPIRPASFETPPAFLGEALPAAGVEAADRSPALLRSIDLVGRKLEVGDGDVSDDVYRSWDDALNTLSSGWVLVDAGLQRDIERRMLDVLIVAERWPDIAERLLAGMAPASTRWVEPLDIWRNAWRAGITGRIAADTSLPPLLFDQARLTLSVAFDPVAADAIPGGFDGAAGLWLDRAVGTLTKGLELDADTYDAWELWLAARERVASAEGFNTALIDAVERILATETDLSQAGPSRNVLGRLLITADFVTSPVVRGRTLALFDDEAIDAHDLWLLTSMLVHLDTSPWFGAELLVAADASPSHRSRVRDRIAAAWPGIAPPSSGGSASGTGLAVDEEAAMRWIGLAGRSLSDPLGLDVDQLMAQLVETCALNEAASLIAAQETMEAQVLMNQIEDRRWPFAETGQRAGVIGQAVGPDGAWAEAYKLVGRNADERLSALGGLRGTAGSDLGPSDASLLIREAYRGTPQEIRDEARSIVLEMFKTGPNVALELLDQFSEAPSTENTSTFLAAVTGRTLPSARSEIWKVETRRALVEHALGLRYIGRQRFDEMARAVAECYDARRLALTGGDRRAVNATRPEDAAERLLDAWFAHAGTLIVSDPVPDDLTGIQRRLAIRSRLVDGAMQRFAARQAALLDVLAYVTVAEQPIVADDVREVLKASAEARASAGHVLEQAIIAERSALPLWRLRMSLDGDRPTAAGGVPVIVALALAGMQSAPADDFRPRLEALSPDDPRAYFLLAEEVADVAADAESLELARRLFGLAGVLDPDRLGRSACLALADLAEDDVERRRLLALGWLIDGGGGAAEPPGRLAEPERDRDAIIAVVEAFSYYRRGQGSRALAELRRSGATELLEAHEDVLRGGVQRFMEDCKLYRGPLRPTLSETDVTRMLLLELALLSTDRPWSAELLLTRGRPLIEVDPEQLPETLEVDAERPYFRDGKWVSGEEPKADS